MSEVELEPCPWCAAEHDRNGNGPQCMSTIKRGPGPITPDKFQIECFGCGASGPYAETKPEAVRQFYTRTPVWTTIEDVPAEKKGDVSDIPDSQLVERAVKNARLGREKGNVRWSYVADAFGLGSTYATQLCRRFGLDPHATLPPPPPKGE